MTESELNEVDADVAEDVVVEVIDDESHVDDSDVDDSDVDDSGVDDVMVLEEVDTELVLPMWEPTGEPRVDEALELLSTLNVDEVHQHAAVYGEIHEKLRGTLSNADASAE